MNNIDLFSVIVLTVVFSLSHMVREGMDGNPNPKICNLKKISHSRRNILV